MHLSDTMTSHKRRKNDRLPKKTIMKRVTAALDKRRINYRYKGKNSIWIDAADEDIPRITSIIISDDAAIIMTLIDRQVNPECVSELFKTINEINEETKYGKFFYSE